MHKSNARTYLAQPALVEIAQRSALDFDTATTRDNHAVDGAQEGRLACTTRPKQGNPFTAIYLKVHPAQDWRPTEVYHYVLKTKASTQSRKPRDWATSAIDAKSSLVAATMPSSRLIAVSKVGSVTPINAAWILSSKPAPKVSFTEGCTVQL